MIKASPCPTQPGQPALDCSLCPRLVAYRQANQAKHPHWHNGPVPSFGPVEAELLIVGLAPGVQGANRTGRPFTGDYAGDLLYPTLLKYGFASGTYGADPKDGLQLINCRITNAVRCVPPENKPTTPEIHTCRDFLKEEIAGLPALRLIIALGTIAQQSVLRCFGLKPTQHRFGHGAVVQLTPEIQLLSSYHCSRYNTSTKRLTPEQFAAIFQQAQETLDAPAQAA